MQKGVSVSGEVTGVPVEPGRDHGSWKGRFSYPAQGLDEARITNCSDAEKIQDSSESVEIPVSKHRTTSPREVSEPIQGQKSFGNFIILGQQNNYKESDFSL